MEGTENIIYFIGISRVFKIKILMGQVKALAMGRMSNIESIGKEWIKCQTTDRK